VFRPDALCSEIALYWSGYCSRSGGLSDAPRVANNLLVVYLLVLFTVGSRPARALSVLVSLILSQHSNITTVPFPVSRSLLITAKAFLNAIQLSRSLDLVITGPRMCAQMRNLPKAEANRSSKS
jgi:hypothetical protein